MPEWLYKSKSGQAADGAGRGHFTAECFKQDCNVSMSHTNGKRVHSREMFTAWASPFDNKFVSTGSLAQAGIIQQSYGHKRHGCKCGAVAKH
mmetsp:Transcript_34655/g.66874  ORF Transcript_34655/g.66874 Transcript_34655/m.66874 type:complete len:92 (-) Transcript_34655:139-414(-)